MWWQLHSRGTRSHFNPEIISWRVWWGPPSKNRLKGFRDTKAENGKSGCPIDLAYRPYNSPALPCWLWRSFVAVYHLSSSTLMTTNPVSEAGKVLQEIHISECPQEVPYKVPKSAVGTSSPSVWNHQRQSLSATVEYKLLDPVEWTISYINALRI